MYELRALSERLLPIAYMLAMALVASSARAQLSENITRWADMTVGLSTSKWQGPRVPFPTPAQRPPTASRVSSLVAPITVHGEPTEPARMARILEAAEALHTLTLGAGLLVTSGDAGGGNTADRDLYIGHEPAGATAYADASGTLGALDGARAFAVVDARLPAERLFACTAQALFAARLLELDPAEAESVRSSSAAYFAWLVSGESCDDEDPRTTQEAPFSAPASGARFLRALLAERDHNRGVFLAEMWQFARQRTWEGRDLRASPDLFEAIGKALELERIELDEQAVRVALALARRERRMVFAIPFAQSPAFAPRRELPPLGSSVVRVELGAPRPGTRLRVWSRGGSGTRYALAAEKLDTRGRSLGFVQAVVRRDPNSQLSIELDEQVREVWVAVTNVGAERPDFDPPVASHSVALTIDHVP
jgi:hypothetical protein